MKHGNQQAFEASASPSGEVGTQAATSTESRADWQRAPQAARGNADGAIERRKAMNIEDECNRIVHAAIAERDRGKQMAMLLQWIVDMGKAGDLFVAPPLDVMLGIIPVAALPAAAEGTQEP